MQFVCSVPANLQRSLVVTLLLRILAADEQSMP